MVKLSSAHIAITAVAVALVLSDPTAVNAFVPRARIPGRALGVSVPRVGGKSVGVSTPPFSPVVVSMSDAAKDDDDDSAAILVVDVEEAKTEAAKNWGWILNIGILNVIGGFMALLLPFYASTLAVGCLTWTLAMLGAVGIGSGLFAVAEPGFKIKSILFGIINWYLFWLMSNDPFGSLGALTLWICAMTITEGCHEAVFAIQNEDTPQRGWNFLSGISSIAVGAYAFAKMPFSSLVVPGIALGVNFITSGVTRIAVGLAGRDEAHSRMGVAT